MRVALLTGRSKVPQARVQSGCCARSAIAALYARILHGAVRVTVTFGDVVEYLGADHAVFPGREVGHYTDPDGEQVPLRIRTTRYLSDVDGRWWQYHHRGSIDDAAALAAYQGAVSSSAG